jgi:hypothetical protein
MHGSVDIDGEEVAVRETLQQICLAILSANRKERVENYDGLNPDRIFSMRLKKVVLDMELYYSKYFDQQASEENKDSEESDNGCKKPDNN